MKVKRDTYKKLMTRFIPDLCIINLIQCAFPCPMILPGPPTIIPLRTCILPLIK